MEWLPHVITGIITAASTGAGMYAWFRKQMIAANKDQLAVDKEKAAVDGVKETAASGAWQQLFDRCESERAEQKAELEELRKEVADLKSQNADQGAQIKILTAQVARLERDSPCGHCPFSAESKDKKGS